jgi:hypothetical protein
LCLRGEKINHRATENTKEIWNYNCQMNLLINHKRFKFIKMRVSKYFKLIKFRKKDNQMIAFDDQEMRDFHSQLLKMKKKRPTLNIERIMRKLYGRNIT